MIRPDEIPTPPYPVVTSTVAIEGEKSHKEVSKRPPIGTVSSNFANSVNSGTAQKQIEDSRLFSKLFEELGEAVLISDHTGRIVRANKAAVRILRIPEERLTQLTHDDPIWKAVREDGTPVPVAELPATKALRTGKPVSNMEIGVVRPDGSLVWILESAAPILDENGSVTGVIVTFPDVSVAVQQRQDLRELSQKYQRERDRANEANRLKSAFLANMSHEIRTPMTAILGFSDVLTGELAGKVSDHHYTFLRSINVSGRRLLTLLNDILDLSKIEAGRVEVEESELDVNAEVDAYITPLVWIAKQKSLSMEIKLHPERLIVRGDRHRFGQVLTNIVSNAIKFTRAGSVTVRTYIHKPESQSKVSQAAVEIEDTGIGIGKDFIPYLFEEFRQEHTGDTKEYGGTGLGLAISQRLVAKMGGTIEVRSNEGVGSVFTILFPLVAVGRPPVVKKKQEEEPPPMVAPPPQHDAVHEDKVHILVVEDNTETQNLIDAYLRENYRVTFASNAQQAIESVERNTPDLILMDINLPGRDGLSVTREIRNGTICPDVPIIALTAFAMSGDRQKCLDAGCTDYLSKPATRREVIEAVNRVLASKAKN